MAITKLMNLKAAPGCPHDHLRNAIDYILDVKHGGVKTAYGALVGGNSGINHREILGNFLETKRDFGKTGGRQGYHFVISFAPGETDAATAYEVMKKFCEQYLGDNYDYVFAVHNDKEHMHGHIIFNSVSRIDGYKYHYKKGDWKKLIQPVTDRICKEHGLEPLTFSQERTGVSYASWAEKKKGNINWTRIMCADADYAIQKSSTMEEFYNIMGKMNYHLEKGYSRSKGEFFKYHFFTSDGNVHKRRSYKMPNRLSPKGYSPKEIEERIQTKELSRRSYEEVVEQLSNKSAGYLKPAVFKNAQTYKRLYQAVSYYKLPNPFAVPAYQVRSDMAHIDKLIAECRYLKSNQVKGEIELKQRSELLEKRLEMLLEQRRALYAVQNGASPEELAAMEQYQELEMQMLQSEKQMDDKFEEIEDEMQEMEKDFPPEMLEVMSRIRRLSNEISNLRKEQKIVDRILEKEAGIETRVLNLNITK